MVQQVEKFGAELEVEFFGDPRLLVQPKIQIPHTIATQSGVGAGGIAECKRRRVGKHRRIEPSIYRAIVQRRADAAPVWALPAAQGERIVHRRIPSERRTAEAGNNPADLPPGQRFPQRAVQGFPKREFIDHARNDSLRLIECGNRSLRAQVVPVLNRLCAQRFARDRCVIHELGPGVGARTVSPLPARFSALISRPL